MPLKLQSINECTPIYMYIIQPFRHGNPYNQYVTKSKYRPYVGKGLKNSDQKAITSQQLIKTINPSKPILYYIYVTAKV